MAKNNLNSLSEEQLGGVSGGQTRKVIGRKQLTPEQKAYIQEGKGISQTEFEKRCNECGVNP